MAKKLKPFTKGDPNNVLVIGDTHLPFVVDGYLEFCREQQELFDCGTVIHIGDILDWHYSSFHGIEPATNGPDNEYLDALEMFKEWKRVFPVAKVTFGNHDLIPYRKMLASGLSLKTAKSWNELYEAPDTWEFAEKFIIDGVMYTHGTNAALARMMNARISVVQGHCHSLQYVHWSQSEVNRLFAMQVGCGIDNEAYAFNYGKSFPKKPVLGCGVVLENGRIPITVPFHK